MTHQTLKSGPLFAESVTYAILQPTVNLYEHMLLINAKTLHNTTQ